jgi:hypothetical protein
MKVQWQVTFRMPSGRCRAILKATAPGSCVACQFTRDRRWGTAQMSRLMPHAATMSTHQRDLLAFFEGQIAPGESLVEGAKCDGGMPPASRNHLAPNGWNAQTSTAAPSLDRPKAISSQNLRRSFRPATPGRPGEYKAARMHCSDLRLPRAIVPSSKRVLR